MDNQSSLNELALFAGAGGGILGGHLLGWRTVCAVEWEPYAASVLVARQNDGILPPFPIWDDVQTFDGNPWRGIVDVVSGGFPCQDISAAGKGAGITGERSGMWKHMARIIGEVRPRYVFVENSPMLTYRGLDIVLADLASLGFDAEWGVISAADTGAPHLRERIWILATDSSFKRWNQRFSNWEERHVLHNINGNAAQSQSERNRWKRGIRAASSNVADTDSLTSKIRRNDFACEEISGKRNNNRDGSGGDDFRELNTKEDDTMANSNEFGTQSQSSNTKKPSEWIDASGIGNRNWWSSEPNVGRVANGVAARVDRLKAIGNGQVPLCAATAWEVLK